MENFLKNWKTCLSHVPYTWKHMLMVKRLQREYLGRVKYPLHDADKLVLYVLLGFIGTKRIQKLHRRFRPHHAPAPGASEKRRRAFLRHLDEAVFDWESARYTKPDKPLDAWETCLKYYPEYEDAVAKKIDELGIPRDASEKRWNPDSGEFERS